MKRFALLILALFSVTLLVACGKKEIIAKFDTQGGTPVQEVKLKSGSLLEEPLSDPTREKEGDIEWSFMGWFEDKEATKMFDFSKPIQSSVTIYAGWTKDIVIRLNSKTSQLIKPIIVEKGAQVTKPEDPQPKKDFVFSGWFMTKRGLTWNELEPVTFPFAADKSVSLHAYWEPVDSVAVNWSNEESFRSSITKQARMILNPLTYENNLEDALISNMATGLFASEVDWDRAIEEGVADFAGDFSKINAGDFSVEALKSQTILIGAAEYPRNAEGDQMLDENGKYDQLAATTNISREWTFKLRDDIFFQDGTQVTAHTYEYTLQQYLSKEQNNYRANTMYKTEANRNGYAFVNAYEYFSQSRPKLDDEGNVVRDENKKIIYEPSEVSWDEVGFKVLDDLTFKVVLHEGMSQAGAIGFGANFRLVHPDKYAQSLDANHNSTYGTPKSPYLSYGPYVLKSWDEDQKLVFNKNYKYVAKETINYKSMVYTLVSSTQETMNLFRDNRIDTLGLNADNYEEFAERGNIYKSFSGFPSFLYVNTAPSTAQNPHQKPTIMLDARFRQALLYAIDRKDYNANFDIPNMPSFVPVPGDIKMYVQDSKLFVESKQYLDLLEKLGIDPESYGYAPNRARELFDAAYADWIAEGNTGPVKLKLMTADSPISKKLGERIKVIYEEFFGKDRLILEHFALAKEQRSQTSAAWDFDLGLGGIGFGGSLGVYWQMGAISFAGGMFGGADLGLSQPYTTDKETGEAIEAPYMAQEVTIKLQTTYEFLHEKGEQEFIDKDLPGTLKLYKWLQEEKDPDTGEVIKEAGVLKATLRDLVFWSATEDTPWDGSQAEPFTGATEDGWSFAAALLEVFYEHVTHIPTGVSADAVLYSDKVVVEWPAYSSGFGWGANRYRYLATDPDFK